MKSNKKFPPALGAVVGQALKDYSAWMKETVQGIPCEAIEKSGLSQEDVEGCVCLTVEEAKALNNLILKLFYNEENRMSVFDATELLTKRIGQAENK